MCVCSKYRETAGVAMRVLSATRAGSVRCAPNGTISQNGSFHCDNRQPHRRPAFCPASIRLDGRRDGGGSALRHPRARPGRNAGIRARCERQLGSAITQGAQAAPRLPCHQVGRRSRNTCQPLWRPPRVQAAGSQRTGLDSRGVREPAGNRACHVPPGLLATTEYGTNTRTAPCQHERRFTTCRPNAHEWRIKAERSIRGK